MTLTINDFKNKKGQVIQGNQRRIIESLLARGKATVEELQYDLGVSSNSIKDVIGKMRQLEYIKRVETISKGYNRISVYAIDKTTPFEESIKDLQNSIFTWMEEFGQACIYDVAEHFKITRHTAKNAVYQLSKNKQIVAMQVKIHHLSNGKAVKYYGVSDDVKKPVPTESVATQYKTGGVEIKKGNSRTILLTDHRHVANDAIGRRNSYCGTGGGTAIDCMIVVPSR